MGIGLSEYFDHMLMGWLFYQGWDICVIWGWAKGLPDARARTLDLQMLSRRAFQDRTPSMLSHKNHRIFLFHRVDDDTFWSTNLQRFSPGHRKKQSLFIVDQVLPLPQQTTMDLIEEYFNLDETCSYFGHRSSAYSFLPPCCYCISINPSQAIAFAWNNSWWDSLDFSPRLIWALSSCWLCLMGQRCFRGSTRCSPEPGGCVTAIQSWPYYIWATSRKSATPRGANAGFQCTWRSWASCANLEWLSARSTQANHTGTDTRYHYLFAFQQEAKDDQDNRDCLVRKAKGL